MSKILIAGAGFAGHFAAMTLSDELKKRGFDKEHEVTVISKEPNFTYIPSLIWVGIGSMDVNTIQFDLKTVYSKLKVNFEVGKVFEIHPDDNYLVAEVQDHKSKRFDYDYLIMSTGPLLNFAATPGLGPDNGHTYSVCNAEHAQKTAAKYLELVDKLNKGDKATIVIGTGHGTCTCQGAAIEYLFNVHFDLVKRNLRDQVKLIWLTNEPKLGDLGIGGVEAKKDGSIVYSEDLVKELFEEYNIEWQIRSHVYNVEEKIIQFETIEGEKKELNYDFAMLLPQFKGQPIKYIGKDESDITDKVCNPLGFVKVDAVYGKDYSELDGPDWPKTYQSQMYKNIFSAGIAFAPPGPLSVPNKSPNGTIIAPAPPRTGFTSELCGRAAALNILELLQGNEPYHSGSMAETAGICVASMENKMIGGNAMIIGVYPVARNRKVYPEFGRDLELSSVDIGLAGAWLKIGLHHTFLYKLSAKPFWRKLP